MSEVDVELSRTKPNPLFALASSWSETIPETWLKTKPWLRLSVAMLPPADVEKESFGSSRSIHPNRISLNGTKRTRPFPLTEYE